MGASNIGRNVVILAPMRSELAPVVRALSLRRATSSDSSVYVGQVGDREVVATTTTMGTRPAAETAERMLASRTVDHMFVVGIAGAVDPGLRIGELLQPAVVLDRSSGQEYRPTMLGPLEPRGTLMTSDEVVVDTGLVPDLLRRGIIAVDMETAAIGAVCERHGCAWSVFRVISDRVDGTVTTDVFDIANPDGSPRPGAAVRFLLTKPWTIPRLVRLARGARLATVTAAAAAAAALGVEGRGRP